MSVDAIYSSHLSPPPASTNICIFLTSSSFQRDYPKGKTIGQVISNGLSEASYVAKTQVSELGAAHA